MSWRGQAGFHSVVAGSRHWVGLIASKAWTKPGRSGGPCAAYMYARVPSHSPCDPRLWGATFRVRLNPKDRSRGEYLRALPGADPRYAKLYPQRNRAEALNETLQYGLANRQARSYGQARQHVDLLFDAMLRNTEALLHWRARTAHAPPALAAA